MRSPWNRAALSVIALTAAVCSTAARADDAAIVEARQGVMKAQGKDMAAIKAYLDDKAALASAQAAGADLVTQVAKVSGAFPKGTGMDAFPGKSYARPVIWTEFDKFSAQVKLAEEKAAALDAALKGGAKPAITAAFGDMGKNGCGGCHEPYREKKPS